MTIIRPSIADRVIAIVAQLFDLDPGTLTPDTQFERDLGLDALDCIDLSITLEEAFGVAFEDEDVSAWTTLGDAIAALTVEAAHA